MKSIVTITEDNVKKYQSYLKMKQRLSKMSRNALITAIVLGVLTACANPLGMLFFVDNITGFMIFGDIFFVLPSMELAIFGIATISLRVKQKLCKKEFSKKYPDVNMNLSEHYIEKLLLEYNYNLKHKPNKLENRNDHNIINDDTGSKSGVLVPDDNDTCLSCHDSQYWQNIKNYWLGEISRQHNTCVETHKEKKLGAKK